MNKILLLFFFTLLALSVEAQADVGKVTAFSKNLIQIVKSSNVEEFKQIECIKIPCGDIGATIVFGDGKKPTRFVEIMSSKDITFKAFGPYTVEEESPNATFTIVFYLPNNSPFDAEGNITMDRGFAELYKSFLQTQVTVKQGKVYFQRVPFYLESHHPYVGDYG